MTAHTNDLNRLSFEDTPDNIPVPCFTIDDDDDDDLMVEGIDLPEWNHTTTDQGREQEADRAPPTTARTNTENTIRSTSAGGREGVSASPVPSSSSVSTSSTVPALPAVPSNTAGCHGSPHPSSPLSSCQDSLATTPAAASSPSSSPSSSSSCWQSHPDVVALQRQRQRRTVTWGMVGGIAGCVFLGATAGPMGGVAAGACAALSAQAIGKRRERTKVKQLQKVHAAMEQAEYQHQQQQKKQQQKERRRKANDDDEEDDDDNSSISTCCSSDSLTRTRDQSSRPSSLLTTPTAGRTHAFTPSSVSAAMM